MNVLQLPLSCKFSLDTLFILDFVLLTFRYDISHDGLIDQKELTTLISAMVNLSFHCYTQINHLSYFQYDLVGETDRKGDRDPKKRAAEIIEKLDVTGDKKLNKEEFTNGYISIIITSTLLLMFVSFIRCKNDEVIRHILAPST
jgi:hypothetical protein